MTAYMEIDLVALEDRAKELAAKRGFEGREHYAWAGKATWGEPAVIVSTGSVEEAQRFITRRSVLLFIQALTVASDEVFGQEEVCRWCGREWPEEKGKGDN